MVHSVSKGRAVGQVRIFKSQDCKIEAEIVFALQFQNPLFNDYTKTQGHTTATFGSQVLTLGLNRHLLLNNAVIEISTTFAPRNTVHRGSWKIPGGEGNFYFKMTREEASCKKNKIKKKITWEQKGPN